MTVNHKVLNVALAAITFFVISSFELCFGQLSKAVLDRPRPNADEILSLLEDGKLVEASHAFFDKLYNPSLPDLVIFAPDDGEIKIDLIQHGKRKIELVGARDLWVMVFEVNNRIQEPPRDASSTMKMEPKRQATHLVKTAMSVPRPEQKEKRLDIRMESVGYRSGFGERGLFAFIKGFASKYISALGYVEPPSPVKDSLDLTLELRYFGNNDDSSKNLYFGMQKLSLAENTINRIRVKPFDSSYVYATVGNYSASHLAASVALTFSWRSDTSGTKFLEDEPEAEIFFFGHVYLMRPQLPAWHSTSHMSCYRRMLSKIGVKSLSVVGGTKITGSNYLDDLFIGLGFGHILGNAGIVAGVNFATLKDGNSQDRYKPEPLAGFYYLL